MKPLDLAYSIQKRLWRVAHPRTRGVKVMLFNASGEIALIRNCYGRSDLFVLPGGGIRPFELPDRAASREIQEELGVAVSGLRERATYASSGEGKRDTIHLFDAVTDEHLQPDPGELVEARFVPLRTLPEKTSPATRRRIEEYLGLRQVDGTW